MILSPSVIQSTQISGIDLDNAGHYLSLDEVFVGDKASKYLSEECDLGTEDIRKFQKTCRAFGPQLSMQLVSFLLKMTF